MCTVASVSKYEIGRLKAASAQQAASIVSALRWVCFKKLIRVNALRIYEYTESRAYVMCKPCVECALRTTISRLSRFVLVAGTRRVACLCAVYSWSWFALERTYCCHPYCILLLDREAEPQRGGYEQQERMERMLLVCFSKWVTELVGYLLSGLLIWCD